MWVFLIYGVFIVCLFESTFEASGDQESAALTSPLARHPVTHFPYYLLLADICGRQIIWWAGNLGVFRNSTFVTRTLVVFWPTTGIADVDISVTEAFCLDWSGTKVTFSWQKRTPSFQHVEFLRKLSVILTDSKASRSIILSKPHYHIPFWLLFSAMKTDTLLFPMPLNWWWTIKSPPSFIKWA